MPNNTTDERLSAHYELELLPTGREVFTPPLFEKRVYRLTFRGSYSFARPFLVFSKLESRADALFEIDVQGNFTKPYDSIRIDGEDANERLYSWTENRERNEYSALLDGSGQQVSIRIQAPVHIYGGFDDAFVQTTFGSITLTIDLLPSTVVTLGVTREREQQQLRLAEEQRAAEEQRRKEEDAKLKRHELIQQTVAAWKREVHKNRNIFDEQYLAAFIRKHSREILTKFRKQWTEEYDLIFADKDTYEELKASAPEVISWHELRIGMILEAERLEALPDEKPPELPVKVDYYDELARKISAGETVSPEPLVRRIEDLQREETIFQAKRRAQVRDGKTVDVIDQRLAVIRREMGDIKGLLDKLHVPIPARTEKPEERAIDEQFFAEYENERKIIARLEADGNPEVVEQVKIFFAERRARLFGQDGEPYA